MATLAHALSDGATLTKRNVIKNRRNIEIVIFSTLAPIAFALLFAYVFGSAIKLQGSSYREFLVAGILAQSALFTASNTGVGLATDMKAGMVDRFRSLPMSQSAVLVGRTTSDALNSIFVLTVMSLTGLLIGWRIRSSVLDAVGGFALLILFSYAFSWVTAAIGLASKSPEVLSNMMFMFLLPMTFISNAFVPASGLPTVLRVIAEWSPVSALVGACRQLFGNVTPDALTASSAWPAHHPVATSLAWIAIILAVFVPLSITRYAKAVTN